MQLMTIGLVELNNDGTPQLNAGQPIPTYSAADIAGLAKVLTGLSCITRLRPTTHSSAATNTTAGP